MEDPGRYGIHELLRQYGDEQLRRMPEALERIRQAHSVYYLRFLAQRTEAMAHSQQRETSAEIAVEFEIFVLGGGWRSKGPTSKAFVMRPLHLAMFASIAASIGKGSPRWSKQSEAYRVSLQRRSATPRLRTRSTSWRGSTSGSTRWGHTGGACGEPPAL
jgi:hypothetical protein